MLVIATKKKSGRLKADARRAAGADLKGNGQEKRAAGIQGGQDRYSYDLCT
jgi:hypothetical protein